MALEAQDDSQNTVYYSDVCLFLINGFGCNSKNYTKQIYIYGIYRMGGPDWKSISSRSQKRLRPKAEAFFETETKYFFCSD